MLIEVSKNEQTGKYEVETNVTVSGGSSSATAYGWEISGTPYWLDIDIAPNNNAEVAALKTITFNISAGAVLSVDISTMPGNPTLTTRTSDTEFTMNINGNDITFTRNSSKDFTLWG